MLVHSNLSNKSENTGGNIGGWSKKARGTESPVSNSAGDVSPTSPAAATPLTVAKINRA